MSSVLLTYLRRGARRAGRSVGAGADPGRASSCHCEVNEAYCGAVSLSVLGSAKWYGAAIEYVRIVRWHGGAASRFN